MKDEITEDSVFEGKVVIRQRKRGYRFSIDAILLYDFIKPAENSLLAEFGTGSGIISILLARKYNLKIKAYELQESLFKLALENITLNKAEDKIELFHGDVNKLLPGNLYDCFDGVYVNPPFKKIASGRINPESEKALARHQLALSTGEILKIAFQILKNRGEFFAIFPSTTLPEIIHRMQKNRLFPQKCRFVHSFKNSISKLVLIKAVKNANCELSVEPPLIIYENEGVYTEEVSRILKGEK